MLAWQPGVRQASVVAHGPGVMYQHSLALAGLGASLWVG